VPRTVLSPEDAIWTGLDREEGVWKIGRDLDWTGRCGGRGREGDRERFIIECPCPSQSETSIHSALDCVFLLDCWEASDQDEGLTLVVP
jgi:hypothetical protein